MARSPLIAVRINEQLKVALDAEVAKSKKTQSEIVATAIAEYLQSPVSRLVRGRPVVVNAELQ